MTVSKRERVAGASRKVRNAPRPNPIERRMSKFLREPPSIRMAASVIVVATTVVVVAGGVAIRALDHREYASVWVGMWWALQTVTTVGYGDVTPKNVLGRVVGVFVMLEGIAFLTILTAAITSTFVARAERERAAAERAQGITEQEQMAAGFTALGERLDRVEAMLRDLSDR